MKKITLTLGAILILLAALFLLKNTRKPSNQNAYKIGILQTASHPALDAVQEGFIEELNTLLDNNIEWTVYNAQGAIPQAHALAQQFHASKNYDAFFAIATPATQALASVEKERPIIIAAVTDPISLGVIHPTSNVCGIKDMINVPAEIDMLLQLLPQAKTVGLLYTSGEINSTTLADAMEKELVKKGITVIHFAVSGETDIQAMTESACRKVDALLTPNDNTVASTISLISSIARSYKKPLIISDNLLVTQGPLAARGVDYKASGKEAAHLAHQVLTQKISPSSLPLKQAKNDMIVINQDTLQLLNINLPETLNDAHNVLLVKDAQ